MGLKLDVRLQRLSDYRGCRIVQCFVVQSNMVTVSQNMVRLERMLEYEGLDYGATAGSTVVG